VNLYNDLSLMDEGGYILRKEIMDNQCYQLMHAEVRFDGRRQITSRDISGGEFITREEYESTDEG
jgi:exosome complex RNA-binding protein Rrp42 (RNase PH superfamily)